jgi:glycosyltransferase involved in cell wall biosynthesis
MSRGPNPKILHVSTYDDFGGAAKAASRILRCQTASGLEAAMFTIVKQLNRSEVFTPWMNDPARNLKFVREVLRSHKQSSGPEPGALLSTGFVGAGVADLLNSPDFDIVNLHWIINMLSIADIGAIKKPVVWTLHDMWPFCGSEHYIEVEDFQSSCYSVEQALVIERDDRGNCIGFKSWKTKMECWKDLKMTIITPSQWLSGLSEKSRLFHKYPTFTIPLPIDTEHEWYPEPRAELRQRYSIPETGKVILCVARDLFINRRKGWDYLVDALGYLTRGETDHEYILMIAGPDPPGNDRSLPVPVRWLGHLAGPESLRQAYSMADVLAVPSRTEVFSLITVEAQACGLPVVAFDNSGPAGIVNHMNTGFLARAFDLEGFAAGIRWVTEEPGRWRKLSEFSRANAIERFSPRVVANLYLEVYQKAI